MCSASIRVKKVKIFIGDVSSTKHIEVCKSSCRKIFIVSDLSRDFVFRIGFSVTQRRKLAIMPRSSFRAHS